MNREDDELGGALDEDTDIRHQTTNNLDLNVEQSCRSPKVTSLNISESNIASTSEANTDAVIKIGTEFESDEHAYKFYNKYATLLGFSVRKDWVNRSKVHGQVVSRKFTCSKEGYRRKDKRDINVKKHRKETRTGCMAHMIITRQSDGKYRVTHFEAQHNHDKINLSNTQTLLLQEELRASGAELPSTFEVQENSVFEQVDRRSGVRECLDYLSADYEGYIRSERTRNMKEGEAGHLIQYFQRQHFENPLFFYAVQLDIDDKVTNLFWSDDNMVTDFNHFGDVVCFDTTCRTNKDLQPFVQFIGVNHHNQVLIFAAALLFDETVESLKWLFHTFLEAMSGKKPKVILTDQDAAIVEAINAVFSEVDHHICVWQMCQNALKHLSHVVKDTRPFFADFKSCIYDQKDEEGFISAWESMLDSYGLQQNEWLRWMFREREKWAVVYGRNTFFIDMNSSHMGENLSNSLRNYLNSNQELLQFIKHFERVINELQYRETEANAKMNSCMPRLMANVVLLKHASEIYTPKAFELLQLEYEKCLNIVVNPCSETGFLSEYKVNTFGQMREYTVKYNSSDNTVNCNCLKFEYVGFLCSHALKVLDHRNIKVVPSQYILKRWTKEARTGSVRVHGGFIEREEDPKLVVARRYKDLCRSMLNLSVRAAESEEAFHFASRQLNEVIEGLEKIVILRPEETQGITSSSNGANASENENAEIFLDESAIEDRDEDSIGREGEETEGAVSSRRKLKNMNAKISKKRVQNRQPHSQNTLTCISSPPASYVSPQSSTPNPVMQGLYNFEANQVVQCVYEQPNLVVDQQHSSNMYAQPNFYTEQHDSPCQTPLMQESLIPSTYHEAVSNATQLRQVTELEVNNAAMEVGIQHPHSSTFLLYDNRYRTSDNSFLGPK
ncbi:protein FAR1-RELATED SEQUENCE 5-like isoform X1 [Carica papaya]|uniref:protein FAR1-RELATED SEQUENCE 5-like isoform X1 n=1 Tax=Carica papaya TaxID=3649 RepID=UPI000B8CE2A0|nr:protein FAR1-RELATED SEQUENCE 5-like isoform X1 [Carica papaya]